MTIYKVVTDHLSPSVYTLDKARMSSEIEREAGKKRNGRKGKYEKEGR